MKTRFALLLALMPSSSAFLGGRGYNSNEFATRKVGELEEMYIADCQENLKPHGYYGAFMEPCEFAFFSLASNPQDPCNEEASELLATPTPMNWVLNLTEHYKENDWDKVDWDNMDWDKAANELLLWPDQCVGVTPKCYDITDKTIQPMLTRLFDAGKIPELATHVRVDCRSDSLAVGRTLYAISGGIDELFPFFIVGSVTLLLMFVGLLACCSYGCFYVCKQIHTKKQASTDNKVIYVALEDGQERTKLVKK